jgi:hypothetical protein
MHIVLQEPRYDSAQNPNAKYLGDSMDLLPKKTERMSLYEPNISRFYMSKSKIQRPPLSPTQS